MSADVAGFLCDKAAVLGDTIMATSRVSYSHVFQSRPQLFLSSVVASSVDFASFNNVETNLATELLQRHYLTDPPNH